MNRYTGMRMNRRRLLQVGGTTAIGAAAVGIVGCGDDDNSTSNTPTKAVGSSTAAASSPTSAAASIKRGGVLKFGFNRDVQGFDPAAVTDSYVGFIFVGGLYDGLVNYTPDYQVGAGLAEKWETPDETTLNFTIRQGVQFHDGEALTADAIAQNLQRVIASGSKAKDKASLTAIDSITAVSPTQLQIKLKSPDSVVLPLLGDYAGMIASPKAFANLMTNPVGTGPMKFGSWEKGNKVTLTKNPNYWGKGAGGQLPYLDGFEYVIIPDLEQEINSLKTGQVHLLTIITGDAIDRIKGDSSMQYIGGPSRLLRSQFINMAWPGLERLEVRQALSMAIDRKALIQAAYAGHAQPAATLGTPGDWVFDSSIEQYKYDVDGAKKLLSQAGFADGLKLQIKVTGQPGEFQTLSDIVRPQLAKAGIDYTYETIDPTASFQLIYREGKTAANIAGNDGRADFGQVADVFLAVGGGLNLTSAYDKNWKLDSDIAQLVTKGRQTLKQEDRKAIYKDLQKQVRDKVYNQNVLCYPEQGWAAAKKVQNLKWYQDARFRLHEVWLQE